MKACISSVELENEDADDWRKTARGALFSRGSFRIWLKEAIDASLGTRKDARSAEHNTQIDRFITIVLGGLGAKGYSEP
jgi:hypothetical protein